MLVDEQLIQSLIRRYGIDNTSTDDGMWYPGVCRFLNVKRHHNYSSIENRIIEGTIKYIKNRTERFDDYFPCRRDNDCKPEDAMKWLNVFVGMHVSDYKKEC